MKNGEQPINVIKDNDGSLLTGANHGWIERNKILIGLTKREHFAGLAMQGLLANEVDIQRGYFETANAAVKMADELLKQLEK